MEYFDIRTVMPPKVKRWLNTDNKELNGEEKFGKEIFESICRDTDGKIPKDIGEMLVRENNNPDYTILIHRTSRVKKEELFHNGLEIRGGTDLEYTTDRYPDNDMSLLINVRDAYGYKGEFDDNPRCVIIKIPNSSLEYIEGKTKPILFQTDKIAEQGGGAAIVLEKYQTVLLPEYILGTVEFDNNKISGFEKNPGYKEIHDYRNEGLVCPRETIESYIDQKMPNRKLSWKETFDKKREADENRMINETIRKQNDKYENRDNYKRTETELKEFSKKNLLLSKFNRMCERIKKFFSKDKHMEDKNNVDRQ